MRIRHLFVFTIWLLSASFVFVACNNPPKNNETTAEPTTDAANNDNNVNDSNVTDTASDAGNTDKGGSDADVKDELPKQKMTSLKDMKANTWHEQWPGGDTICSRGTPFAFYVRPGKINKVLIDFEGGGACWNAGTCSVGKGQVFKDSIDNIRKMMTGNSIYNKGIYNHDKDENPFKDWHHVFIPYCTGDIHWGNNYMEYKNKDGSIAAKIHHKGAVNVRAVLKWVFDNYKKPEQVFMTGCSAGAYGSIAWSPFVARQYKDTSKVMQMGDCGAGIVTKNFLKDSFPQWKADQALPEFIPGLNPSNVDITTKNFAYLYKTIANHYSNLFFSQYNTIKDENQTFYFNLMGGGKADDWSREMMKSMKDILDNTKNFRAYVAPGEKHCIVPFDKFYTVKAGDVLLTDWIKGVIKNNDAKNVFCKDCKLPDDKP